MKLNGERINDVERIDRLAPLTKVRSAGVEYLLAKADGAGRHYCIRMTDGELVRVAAGMLVEVVERLVNVAPVSESLGNKAAKALGKIGGTKTAKRGPEYYSRIAGMRKDRRGGHPSQWEWLYAKLAAEDWDVTIRVPSGEGRVSEYRNRLASALAVAKRNDAYLYHWHTKTDVAAGTVHIKRGRPWTDVRGNPIARTG